MEFFYLFKSGLFQILIKAYITINIMVKPLLNAIDMVRSLETKIGNPNIFLILMFFSITHLKIPV